MHTDRLLARVPRSQTRHQQHWSGWFAACTHSNGFHLCSALQLALPRCRQGNSPLQLLRSQVIKSSKGCSLGAAVLQHLPALLSLLDSLHTILKMRCSVFFNYYHIVLLHYLMKMPQKDHTEITQNKSKAQPSACSEHGHEHHTQYPLLANLLRGLCFFPTSPFQ